MSRNQLLLSGFAEEYELLRSMPAHLTQQGGAIVTAYATRAFENIGAAYPTFTGNLKRHLKLRPRENGPFGAAVVVTNSAYHAWLFENGTQGKHRFFGTLDRGAMPAGNIFIPEAIRQRRGMLAALVALVRGEGFTVAWR